MKVLFKKYFGIIAFVFALIVKWMSSFFPQQLEQIYSNQIYGLIRNIIDNTIGTLSFNFIYLVLSIVAIALLIQILQLIKGNLSLKNLGLRMANFLGALYAIFLLSWGLNYERPPVKVKLQLIDVQENAQLYNREFHWALSKAIEKRNQIKDIDTTSIDGSFLDSSYNDEIKSIVQNTVLSLGYKIIANPPLREIGLNGFMRKMNISGIYMPFTGEALVDGTELPIKIIFTKAHELAHAYGIGNEGEANFIAFLACINSKDPLIEYAGYYNYWRYVASKLRGFDDDLYEKYHKNLPIGIRADRMAIIEDAKLYSAWFPEASDFVNDSYLKAQGVDNGVESYDDFTLLVISYKNKINR